LLFFLFLFALRVQWIQLSQAMSINVRERGREGQLKKVILGHRKNHHKCVRVKDMIRYGTRKKKLNF
jgi:hypothetical protein